MKGNITFDLDAAALSDFRRFLGDGEEDDACLSLRSEIKRLSPLPAIDSGVGGKVGSSESARSLLIVSTISACLFGDGTKTTIV